MNIKIGLDATSIVDGGGLTHLKNLLLHFIGTDNDGKLKIIIYASKKVLVQLPKNQNLIKRTHSYLNKSIFHRIFFQTFFFDEFLNRECDILFSLTGDYNGSFRPYIGMSQNMLLHEREFWKDIKSLKEKGKIYFNFKRQKKCFNNAEGLIFLSEYAKNYILKGINKKNINSTVINHGISSQFISNNNKVKSIENFTLNSPFKFLYVSTVHVYKNQWNVVKAISKLRDTGYPIELTLIGDIIYNPAGDLLKKTIMSVDPDKKFINHILKVPHDEIADYYQSHDGIIFASSCENMPNILLESMGAGKPIACSDKSPMDEFLMEGGVYFDAKSINSIFKTLENMLNNLDSFEVMNFNNKKELKRYSWDKTSTETIKFIINTYNRYNNV